MEALLSIDYTYDFVATDGKLTTGQVGQDIEEALVSLTADFIERDQFVVLQLMGMTQQILFILKINYFHRIMF